MKKRWTPLVKLVMKRAKGCDLLSETSHIYSKNKQTNMKVKVCKKLKPPLKIPILI